MVSIYAGASGFLDSLPVSQVLDFEAEMLKAMRTEHPEVMEEIVREGKISDDLEGRLKGFLGEILIQFQNTHAS